MSLSTAHARKPWLAAVLALVCPGLGHVYAGHLVRGILFFLAPFAAALVVTVLSFVEPSRGVLLAIAAAWLAPIVTHLVSILDAWLVARGGRPRYVLRAYNRAPVYVGLFAFGIVLLLAVVLLRRAFVFEAFLLPTASMRPTLRPGDRIFVTKHAYWGAAPQRGDVVVFRHPQTPSVRYVKRIAALAGERHPEAAEPVPAGHVFVLGDDLKNSRDSRHFGPVPVGSIVGKATYLFWARGTPARLGVVR